MKKCLVCGKEHNNNKYCSNKCSNESNKSRSREIRKCKICGVEFEVYKRTSTQTCSSKCKYKLNSHIYKNERFCEYDYMTEPIKKYKYQNNKELYYRELKQLDKDIYKLF